MGLISFFRGILSNVFKDKAKDVYNVHVADTNMEQNYNYWYSIYSDKPPWENDRDATRRVNFAKSVTEETARLTMQEIEVTIDGTGERQEYLQGMFDTFIEKLNKKIELPIAIGTCAFKPNGTGIDVVTYENMMITSYDDNGKVNVAVFFSFYQENDYYYTRIEKHERFETYRITNKAYMSDTKNDVGKEVQLSVVKPWKDIMPMVEITKNNGEPIEDNLFAMFDMPFENNLNSESKQGISLYSNACNEIMDFDIAYTKIIKEIIDSDRIVFADGMLFEKPMKDNKRTAFIDSQYIPKFVKKIMSNNVEDNYIQEFVPTLQADERIKHINFILSMLGFKCGYSNGYFVLDEKTSMITATQVESTDRRTITLIDSIRDQLEIALNDLKKSLDIYADLIGVQQGETELQCHFGDITYNYQEDKTMWLSYANTGKIPFWYYLTVYEKMSEEDAKALTGEMEEKEKQAQQMLY